MAHTTTTTEDVRASTQIAAEDLRPGDRFLAYGYTWTVTAVSRAPNNYPFPGERVLISTGDNGGAFGRLVGEKVAAIREMAQ